MVLSEKKTHIGNYQERQIGVRRYLKINGTCLMRYGNIIIFPLAQTTPSFLPGGLPSYTLPSLSLVILLYAMRNITCGCHIKTKANRPHDTVDNNNVTIPHLDFRQFPPKELLHLPTAFVCYPDRSVPFIHLKGANVGTSSSTLSLNVNEGQLISTHA